MEYIVTIKPAAVDIKVSTLSGPDVAEEWARRMFLQRIVDGKLHIHDADHSVATVRKVEHET
jgi:hypothetical protein